MKKLETFPALPVAADLRDSTILFRALAQPNGLFAVRVYDHASGELESLGTPEYDADDLTLAQVLARAVKCFVAEWDGACAEGMMFSTIIKQFSEFNSPRVL